MPIFFKTIKSFSSTFQGKFPIFKADWKIKHFSRQHSNSSTFQGLWEPWKKNLCAWELSTCYSTLPIFRLQLRLRIRKPQYWVSCVTNHSLLYWNYSQPSIYIYTYSQQNDSFRHIFSDKTPTARRILNRIKSSGNEWRGGVRIITGSASKPP